MSDENNRNLKCPICHEIFKDPKMLPCGHSFCGECLTRMTQGQNVHQVTCPNCREVAHIPRNGFPANYALHGVAEDAADAARKFNEEVRKNTATSAKEFQENVSTICQQLNEKLTKWNKISELLNAMVAKSFEMTETTQSMDMDYCQKSMKDIEEMKEIVTDIATNFDLLDETRLLTTLRANPDNILIKDTFSRLEARAENFSTVSLEQDQIGASSEPTGINERASFASVVMENKLLVFGGVGGCYNLINYCEYLNPITNTWYSLPNMDYARAAHCAVEFDRQAYIIGGTTISGQTLSDLSVFNPYKSCWISATPMKQGRQWAGAGKLGSEIVVTGGFDDDRTLNSCELLDPREKKWMDIAPMQRKRRDHVLVSCDGKLLAMGGCQSRNMRLSCVEQYDQRANKWRFEKSLIIERAEFAAIAVP